MTDADKTGSNGGKGNDSQAERLCPTCHVPLVLRRTKKGHLLGCPNYPLCQYVENVSVQGVVTVKIIPDFSCPECGAPVAVKKSRYGMFAGCTRYPDCSYIYADREENPVGCPACGGGVLKLHANKFGKSFYSCSNFKACGFTVNYPPVQMTCPKCGFPLMMKRRRASGIYYQCPMKSCRARVDDI